MADRTFESQQLIAGINQHAGDSVTAAVNNIGDSVQQGIQNNQQNRQFEEQRADKARQDEQNAALENRRMDLASKSEDRVARQGDAQIQNDSRRTDLAGKQADEQKRKNTADLENDAKRLSLASLGHSLQALQFEQDKATAAVTMELTKQRIATEKMNAERLASLDETTRRRLGNRDLEVQVQTREIALKEMQRKAQAEAASNQGSVERQQWIDEQANNPLWQEGGGVGPSRPGEGGSVKAKAYTDAARREALGGHIGRLAQAMSRDYPSDALELGAIQIDIASGRISPDEASDRIRKMQAKADTSTGIAPGTQGPAAPGPATPKEVEAAVGGMSDGEKSAYDSLNGLSILQPKAKLRIAKFVGSKGPVEDAFAKLGEWASRQDVIDRATGKPIEGSANPTSNREDAIRIGKVTFLRGLSSGDQRMIGWAYQWGLVDPSDPSEFNDRNTGGVYDPSVSPMNRAWGRNESMTRTEDAMRAWGVTAPSQGGTDMSRSMPGGR